MKAESSTRTMAIDSAGEPLSLSNGADKGPQPGRVPGEPGHEEMYEPVLQTLEGRPLGKRLYHSFLRGCKRLQGWLGYAAHRCLRFAALPYAVIRCVDWSVCKRNPFLVAFDHLYLYLRIGYYPDNYNSCRLWEKKVSEWKYYYGSGYDPKAIRRRNRKVRRPEAAPLFEDKEVCYHLCNSFGFRQPHYLGSFEPGDHFQAAVNVYYASGGSGRLFIKPVGGDGGTGSCIAEQCDDGIVIRQISDPEKRIPLGSFHLAARSVVQGGVSQHPAVAELFGGSLNTVRIATMFTPQREVIVVGAFLRIGRGANFVDNGTQGGIGAAIDLDTGCLASRASDNRGRYCETHPDTGFRFSDLTLPYWEEVMEMARKVQLCFSPFNKFIGMDIGIAEDGAVLIEVNDIFDAGRFESVVGPLLKNRELLPHFQEYGLITHSLLK